MIGHIGCNWLILGCFISLRGASAGLDFVVGVLDVLNLYFVGALECSSCLIFPCSLFDRKLVQLVFLVVLQYKA